MKTTIERLTFVTRVAQNVTRYLSTAIIILPFICLTGCPPPVPESLESDDAANVGLGPANESWPGLAYRIWIAERSADCAGWFLQHNASNDPNSFHIVTGSGTNSTAILDGFSIMAGNADGTNPYNLGGGMYNSSGTADH